MRENRPRRGWMALAVIALSTRAIWIGLQWSDADMTGLPRTAPSPAMAPLTAETMVVRSTSDSAPSVGALPPPRADAIELCGGGTAQVLADGSLAAADGEPLVSEALARATLFERLRADPREVARAAALFVELAREWQRRLLQADATTACRSPPCLAPERPTAPSLREALVSLALTTSDPHVYALAYKACEAAGHEGACRQLSAAQWARLDAGNANPWLAALTEAMAAKDAVRQAEALHRIATSQRNDVDFFVVPGLVAEAAGDDESLLQAAATMAVQSMAILSGLPDYASVHAMCRGPALTDSNRLQTCAAVARLMIDQSSEQIGRLIGIGVGRNVGFAPEHEDRLRGEWEAFSDAQSRALNAVVTERCGLERHSLDAIRRRARVGEVADIRAWVADSGKTAQDFIAIGQKRRQAVSTAALVESPPVISESASASGRAASR